MNPETPRGEAEKQSRDQKEADLEAHANRLLVESLKTLGRGEYPFYSASYLRRMATTDERAALEDEATHPEPPRREVTAIWRLARKARLSSIETDILRVIATGGTSAIAAEILGIPRRRATRLLRRAIEKMRRHVAEAQASLEEELACVMYEDQRRRAYSCEKHCKRGREACRRTGLCPKRWYLLRDDP